MDFLTVSEAAKRLKVHPDTVRAMLKRRDLRGKRLHKTGPWRIEASSVEQVLGGGAAIARGARITGEELHRRARAAFIERQRAGEGR